MRLTTKGAYAVQAVLDLAFNSQGRAVKLKEIGHRQDNVSVYYLEQIFSRLRKGSVVGSVRGRGGGYVLSRSMDEISLKDVLLSSGENIDLSLGLFSKPDVEENNQSVEFLLTKTYFEQLGALMQEHLSTTSLGDLIRKAKGIPETLKKSFSEINFDPFNAPSQEPYVTDQSKNVS